MEDHRSNNPGRDHFKLEHAEKTSDDFKISFSFPGRTVVAACLEATQEHHSVVTIKGGESFDKGVFRFSHKWLQFDNVCDVVHVPFELGRA